MYGAESWIRNNPHRVFLDKKCQNKFPFDLSNKKLEIHLVALTKNTLEPAKNILASLLIGAQEHLCINTNWKKKMLWKSHLH
ncbi:hypothetical protein [Acinetobacter soli]|uniref:hypothetical protein n=1 Tax=Acinetobacter soli TaxID=487316 RepID=UPI00208FBB5E|nr:hypothetical protein [Acinetobacter soli]